MLYCWFSKQIADAHVNTRVTDLDGNTHTDQGYAIGIDHDSNTAFQYIQGTNDPKPPVPTKDMTLVATVDVSQRNDIVAVDGFGNLTPAGENFCKLKNLPPSAESVKSQVANFYTPQSPPGIEPMNVDIRTLRSAPKPR